MLDKKRFGSISGCASINGMVNYFLIIPEKNKLRFEIEFYRLVKRFDIKIMGYDKNFKLRARENNEI